MMGTEKKIFIIAGEPSGDFHAANLAREIRRLVPGVRLYGLGGSRLIQEGLETSYTISDLAVTGAAEVVGKLPKINMVFRGLLREVERIRPDLIILVDYPGFNIRFMKAVGGSGIPIVYFISPQIWAWGKDRIRAIKRYVKRMIVFFPFEEALYTQHGVAVTLIGHPLKETVRPSAGRDILRGKFGLSEKKTVAILPGSRVSEVRNLLPVALEAARLIDQAFAGVHILVSKVPDLDRQLYEKATGRFALDMRLIEGNAYDVLGAADCAIIASGTATLEAAIVGTPMVIIYKSSFLTWLLFKAVVRIPRIGLVNVIAGEEAVPELIQFDATPRRIARTVIEILRDDAKRAQMTARLRAVTDSLGAPGSYRRAADAVCAEL